MKLTLVNQISLQFRRKPDIIWALEKQEVFLISDRWKMLSVDAKGSVNLLWETADKETSRQLENVYDDRLADPYYDELREAGSMGFSLLSKLEYDDIFANVLLIDRRIPLITREKAIIDLADKAISLLQIDEGHIAEIAKVKTKGKAKTVAQLHPQKNILVYGTNYGELFAQPFDQEKFGKTIKLDQMLNVCYQIGFSGDGSRMFVAGLGYLKIYDFNGATFTPTSSLMTAARSFLLVDNYMILNKGLHGIDVLRIGEKAERVSSLDLPFAVDSMVYLPLQKTFLVTSGSSNDLCFLKWES